ncbi:TaqI-like C-terminal specificity domain-containing protein [Helicobacter sp. 23-1048]
MPSEIYSQSIQEDFKKPKIVIARMTKHIQASFDDSGFYMGKATLIVDCKENPYYILGILNSKLADFWYKYYFGATHLGSGYIRYDIPYLKQLPIPKITAKNKPLADKIIACVDTILTIKNPCHTERSEVSQKIDNRDISAFSKPQYDKKIKDLESKIDSLVYQLYDLDSQEIEIIES